MPTLKASARAACSLQSWKISGDDDDDDDDDHWDNDMNYEIIVLLPEGPRLLQH